MYPHHALHETDTYAGESKFWGLQCRVSQHAAPLELGVKGLVLGPNGSVGLLVMGFEPLTWTVLTTEPHSAL